MGSWVLWVCDIDCPFSCCFRDGSTEGGNHDCPLQPCLHTGHPKALIEAWEQEGPAVPVQAVSLLIGDSLRQGDTGGELLLIDLLLQFLSVLPGGILGDAGDHKAAGEDFPDAGLLLILQDGKGVDHRGQVLVGQEGGDRKVVLPGLQSIPGKDSFLFFPVMDLTLTGILHGNRIIDPGQSPSCVWGIAEDPLLRKI